MTSKDNDYIVVGKIGSTYGVKGWLKILSYTEIADNILDYNPWYVENNHDWKAFEIESGKGHGKGVIAKLVGFNSPEHAKMLSGKNIAILRTQLPKLDKNEFYWSDLKGLTVIDQRGEVLGKVIYLIATGSNDVLVVKGEREHAIPYLPGKVVTSIDLAKQEMHVNWEII